ncbi:alpha/beta-hydrolase [Peniophora sp. CONT]|nr:alpha/beta-hydrolase [Peniophora sp. CONT]
MGSSSSNSTRPPPTADVKIVRSSDGEHIYAEATGDPSKPHAVLLHGLALSGAVFDEFCATPKLLENLYIVRYDIRGHGRSGMPMSPEGHASKLYADDFKAVVDAFELRKPTLIGWSMGGIISADIAAHLPADTLSGIFYLSSAPHKNVILGPAAAPALGAAIQGCSSPSTLLGALVDFADACISSPTHPTSPYHLRCQLVGAMALQPNDMRGLILTREQDSAPLEKLLAGGIPVLVMYGTEDKLTQGGVVEDEIRKHAKEAELLAVPGAGHMLFWEKPTLVASTVVRFVTERAQPS